MATPGEMRRRRTGRRPGVGSALAFCRRPGLDRVGARGAWHFQSSGKFSPARARLGPRAVLDAPGTARDGRIGKPGSECFCPPNESAGQRLAQPDNLGKADLQAMPALGWGAGVCSQFVPRRTPGPRALESQRCVVPLWAPAFAGVRQGWVDFFRSSPWLRDREDLNDRFRSKAVTQPS